ncbi:RNA-directed RNA polymerase [ssRNA phage SRR5466725_4]|uniref:RNA-directed RNA polymerase n=1 Tax=ssRNA phage SRR5466725_4 TaxID=2786423 RepID=A0A8S5L4Q1_9VIRU|nr:RNA-directed RNA polymerase [ssRNA phage SRR5466725_4]DAD52404.1 TPA_asm: RNA-directed RNA polymerase [ssRNA phage SRR5466725_4]
MRVNATALSKALLSDLQDEIDVQLPSWAPDSTPRQVACYALRDSLLKKFNEADKPSDSACAAALEKFHAVNKRCGDWINLCESSLDEMLVEGVRDALYSFWFKNHDTPLVSSINELFVNGRAGPGSSVKARDSDFYTKMFDSSLTGTGDLPYCWGRLVCISEVWREAELLRQSLHGTTVVESSNYSFVNKTTKIARGICTEPSINMWFQLGLGGFIEHRLKTVFGIDLGSQPYVNSVMARRGSLGDGFDTIDLESASDSIALNMLEDVLPRDFLRWLKLLRCKSTILPNKEVVQLNMVSTMGNGFTFPLETLIFSCIVQSVYRSLDIPMKGKGEATSRNFAVFGDDIIVDSRATRRVLRLLHLLGFVVNADKTFVEGQFRESCGADYVSGVNVRGVYVKSLKTEQDLCVAINVLNRWTAKTGVSLTNTVSVLLNGIRNPTSRCVPPDEDDASGIHIPECMVRTLVGTVRGRGKVPLYRANHGGLRSYDAFVPRSWEFLILGGVCWTFKEQVRRNYNPSGLLIAFLSGNIRGCRVSLRQRVIRYTSKRRWTPRWGYLSPRPLEGLYGPNGSRQFVDACTLNLVSSGFGAEA